MDKEKILQLKLENQRLVQEYQKLDDQFQLMQKAQSISQQRIDEQAKVHNERIKSHMNTIDKLRKENQELAKLQNESARSKLIEKQQKDIIDMELAMNIYKKFIPESDLAKAQAEVVKELTKGPERVRVKTKEELVIQIKNLEAQLAQSSGGRGGSVKGSFNAGKNLTGIGKTQSKMEESKVSKVQEQGSNQSDLSQLSSGTADSIDKLIQRLEQLKTENEDLKLNLRTQQEKVDQLQDEMDRKHQEIKNLNQFKLELIFLQKKYEDLQAEANELKQQASKQDIKYLTNEAKVDELQILNRNQLSSLKLNEQALKNQVLQLEKQLQDLEVKLMEVNSTLSMVTDQRNALQEDINNERRQKAEINHKREEAEKAAQLATNKLEKLKQQIETEQGKSKKANDAYEKLQIDIEQKEKKIIMLEAELQNIKMRGGVGSAIPDGISMAQSWMSGTIQGIGGDNKELRTKVKEMTKNQIELQDKIEQLEEELKFREQREKTMNLLNKKKPGATMELEEQKKQYQKEIQARYTTKVATLIKRIEELEARNKQLISVHKMMEKKTIMDDAEISSVGSEVSMSLEQLEKIGVDDNISDISYAQMSEIRKKMVLGDHQDLKQKVFEMQSRELKLIDTIKKLQKEVDKKLTPDLLTKEEKLYHDKIELMKNDYEKVIRDLSKKIAKLQTQEVNLKMMDSNVGSELFDQNDLGDKDLQDINSEIDFDLQDIQQENLSKYSEVSSKVQEIVKQTEKQYQGELDASSDIDQIIEEQKKLKKK